MTEAKVTNRLGVPTSLTEARVPKLLHGTMKHILVPLDGSSGAQAALPVALALAHQLGVHVGALYVSPSRVDPPTAAELLGIPPGQATEIGIRTVVGAPADEILKAALDDNVELVVMATAGHSALASDHLAPVAEEIASRSVRPVVFVPPGPTGGPCAYRRLLIPVDGSRRTTCALRPAMRLAQRLDASLDLLYVVTPQIPRRVERSSLEVPMYVDQAQEWSAWADSTIERYRHETRCGASLRTRLFLRVGNPAQEIIRFAHEQGEDAIVLVRRSHLEYGHGAILRTVLAQTRWPVIVAPDCERKSASVKESRRLSLHSHQTASREGPRQQYRGEASDDTGDNSNGLAGSSPPTCQRRKLRERLARGGQ
jgi:nucleotide-binding universal stress UspA family protein